MKVKFDSIKAHQTYTVSGKEVPGVTTVLGILEKPGLHKYFVDCGKDGIDPRKTADKAANIGTIAHWLIYLHLTKQEPDMGDFSPNDTEKAENAVIKFMSWWDAGKFKLVKSEYQLVAKREPYYGGTLDVLAKDMDGKPTLIDLKTSKGIYLPEYLLQIAAYGELVAQNQSDYFIKGCIPERYIIVRIGKEGGEDDFETMERTDLTKYREAFLSILQTYYALKGLKEPRQRKNNAHD